LERTSTLFRDVWPEYNHHGDYSGTHFGALVPQHAHLQILVYDRSADCVVARGRTIPCRWDGSLEDLPGGIDALGLRAIHDTRTPTAMSALAAEVATDQQGRGLSRLVVAVCGSVVAKVARGPDDPSCCREYEDFAKFSP
jgi:hypothetical protein